MMLIITIIVIITPGRPGRGAGRAPARGGVARARARERARARASLCLSLPLVYLSVRPFTHGSRRHVHTSLHAHYDCTPRMSCAFSLLRSCMPLSMAHARVRTHVCASASASARARDEVCSTQAEGCSTGFCAKHIPLNVSLGHAIQQQKL